MKFVKYCLLLSIFLCLSSAAFAHEHPVPMREDTSEKRVIAYYPNWAENRMDIETIPGHLLTHINYAFIDVSTDGECLIDNPTRDAAQLVKLRTLYPDLELILSIGGWTWSENFSAAAWTEESRQKFAQSCVNMMVEYDFDGLDIDWEFPGRAGEEDTPANLDDATNFTLLLEELRIQLDEQGEIDDRHYELSIAAPSSEWFYKILELDVIHKYLDFINLMTYSFVGGWSSTTGIDSSLYPTSSALSVHTTVDAFLAAGTPPDKLIVGISYFGVGWTGVPSANNGLFQSTADTERIDTLPLLYRNLLTGYLTDPNYVRHWEPRAAAPYLYNETNGAFIAYTDPQAVYARSQYVLEYDLGGAMFWEMTGDNDEYDLTTTLMEGFTHQTDLLAPTDSITVTDVPELSWQSNMSVTEYIIEIADNPYFTDAMEMTTTDNSYTPNLGSGLYYWRVQPMTEWGESLESLTRSFTIDEGVFAMTVNCNPEWELVDVLLIKQLNVFMIPSSAECASPTLNTAVYLPACDRNNDGVCGLIDAVIIQQCNAFVDNSYCP